MLDEQADLILKERIYEKVPPQYTPWWVQYLILPFCRSYYWKSHKDLLPATRLETKYFCGKVYVVNEELVTVALGNSTETVWEDE